MKIVHPSPYHTPLTPPPGRYKLYLYQAGTKEEVAGSPISFDVLPAAASATMSTHNMDDTTTYTSGGDFNITLKVFAKDQYGNDVLDATGFTVRMGEQKEQLEPPDYLWNFSIHGCSTAIIKGSIAHAVFGARNCPAQHWKFFRR